MRFLIVPLALCYLSMAFGAGPSAGSLADPSIYQHHPDSVLALGRGFNPNDITVPKIPCLLDPLEVKLDPGARKTEYRMFLAESDYAIDQAMSFESKISATSLGGPSGSASLGMSQTSKFDGSHRRVIIWLFSDYGRFGLKAPVKLTAEAQALLPDPVAFDKSCGTRLVLQDTRMSWIAVSVEVDTASSLLHSDFHGSASGSSGNASPLNATAEASFRQVANISNKNGRLQINITSSGGTGHAQLSDVVKAAKASPDVITQLLDGVAKYNETFGATTSVPIRYSVASFKDTFAPAGSEIPPWPDESEQALRDIALRYRSNEELLTYAEQFRDDPAKSPFKVGYASPAILPQEITVVKLEQDALKLAWKYCKLGLPQGYIFHGTGQRTEIPPCAVPPKSGYLGEFDLTQYRKPSRGYGMAYEDEAGNSKVLSDDGVRQILRATADKRVSVAHEIDPAIGSTFVITHFFDGSFMSSRTFYFIDKEGAEESISQEGDANGAGIWWDASSPNGLESKLFDYLQKLRSTGEGVVFSRIKTRFNTTFDVPVLKVSWSRDKVVSEYLFTFDK